MNNFNPNQNFVNNYPNPEPQFTVNNENYMNQKQFGVNNSHDTHPKSFLMGNEK